MRKLFASITLPITEEEYRNDGNLHYSTLAKYDREGFNAIPHLGEKIDTPSLLFGSLVDIMLTGSRDEFDKQYVLADFVAPKPMHMNMAKALYEKYHLLYSKVSKIPDAAILETANEVEFGKNWREQTRIDSAKKDCEEYYSLLMIAEGRTVVDSETYNDATAAARALRESPATAWYFAKDNPFDGVERVYQAKFKAEFDGIMYSAMADLIVIDHNAKIIYPCDLKTSSHMEHDFFQSFLEWRYYIQANQYAAIIKKVISEDEYFKDFTISNYRFIVVNRHSLKPLVWEYPYTFADVTVEIPNSKGYPYRFRNFREIGQELHHYLETGQDIPDGIKTDGVNNLEEWIKKM